MRYFICQLSIGSVRSYSRPFPAFGGQEYRIRQLYNWAEFGGNPSQRRSNFWNDSRCLPPSRNIRRFAVRISVVLPVSYVYSMRALRDSEQKTMAAVLAAMNPKSNDVRWFKKVTLNHPNIGFRKPNDHQAKIPRYSSLD